MKTNEEIKPRRTKLVEKFLSPENHTDRIEDLYDTCDILDRTVSKAEERLYKLEIWLFLLTVYSILRTIIFFLI